MYATSQGMVSQQVPDFYEFTRDGIIHSCEITQLYSTRCSVDALGATPLFGEPQL